MARVASRTFVGRDEELADLLRLHESAAGGKPSFAVLAGDAGVGKTRLVSELASRATASGSAVLQGGCLDLSEGALAYGPIIEALRNPAARSAIARLEPEIQSILGPFLPGLPKPFEESPQSGGSRAALFESVRALLELVSSETTTVLVIEDLHWADDSTRDLLTYLVHNATDERLFCAITYRSDEIHRRHPLRPWISEMVRNPDVVRVEVPPLTRAEVTDQISGIVGDSPAPALVDAVYERTEGNAFFTEELIAADARGDEIPPTLKEVLLARLDGLPRPTRSLLDIVAVASKPVSAELIAEIGGGTAEEVEETLQPALDAYVIRPVAESYAFRHALMREALYGELLPTRRRQLHAAVIAPLGRENPVPVAELAHHAHVAGEAAQAFGWSLEAGTRAETDFAYPEARQHFERALALWDNVTDHEIEKVELLRRAAAVASLAADPRRAVALIEEALQETGPEMSPEEVALLYERLSTYLFVGVGDDTRAMEAAKKASELLHDRPASPQKAHAVSGLARLSFLRQQPGRISSPVTRCRSLRNVDLA